MKIQIEKNTQTSATWPSVLIVGDVEDSARHLLADMGLLDGNYSELNSVGSTQDSEIINTEICKLWAPEIAADTAEHLLVIYESLENFLVGRLSAEESFEEAVSLTAQYAEDLLKTFRSHRHQVTLMESVAFISKPTVASRVIEKRTGMAVKSEVSKVAHKSGDICEVSHVLALLALNATYEHPELKTLTAELKAGSAMSSNGDTRMLSVRAEVLIADSQEKVKKLQITEDQNKLLLLRVNQLREELDEYSTEQGALKDALAEAESRNHVVIGENDELRLQIAEIAALLDDASASSESLRLENAALLDHASASSESLRLENAALRSELDDKIEQLAQVKGLLHENKKVLAGIMEAEQKLIKETTARHKEDALRCDHLYQQIKDLQQKNREAEENFAVTQSALLEHRLALHEMTRSLSWRLTAPPRWALGIFISPGK